jgi:pimeloyl-ACP methyl ester carboxylesterase
MDSVSADLPALPVLPYTERRPATDRWVDVRGQPHTLRYHLRCWGDPRLATPSKPPLVLMHGWMDVAASFQFMVDALHAIEGESRYIVAADWRGFGLSDSPPTDSFWFPDYLADLDRLLDTVLAESPGLAQLDLLGHSMGGNVVMSYAGLRPGRIRRLVNLEGFGLPRTTPEQAPQRLLQWLDELKAPAELRDYDSAQAVAGRLMKNNPLLPPDKAAWLAEHWARPDSAGRWQILGDPAHKRVNPMLYQVDEVLASWRQIHAPVLWVEGDQTDVSKWWGKRYRREEFETRLAVVPYVRRAMLSPCGHMLHHDQPEALAVHLLEHLA